MSAKLPSTVRRKRSFHAALLDAVGEAVVAVDLEGRTIYWNRAAERVYGWSVEEMLGEPSLERLVPSHMHDLARSLADLVRSDGVWEGEFTVLNKDGNAFPAHITGSLLRDDDGNVIGAVGVSTDISERRVWEDALRESEERFRQAADAMPLIVWGARPDGNIDYANQRWFDFTGWSPGDGNTDWVPLIHPDDLKESTEVWRQAVAAGEPYELQYRMIDLRTNRYRWYLSRAIPVLDAAGDVVRWYGTSTDIDEQKRVEDELRRANAAKDEFVSLISHELRTPITTVMGNAEILLRRDDKITPNDRLTALEDISREAGRLSAIVENLLVLARLDRGQEVASEPIYVARLVERSVTAHRLRFPSRRVTLESEATGAFAMGEPMYIERVMENLLSNAEKYSPIDGAIEVRVGHADGEIAIHVLDRGDGFPEDEAPALFTPFYRSSRTSAKAAGFGVGLAVCKRLVEVQGGRIWAAPREGGGADIGFSLPCGAE